MTVAKQRLPSPYHPEADIVAEQLTRLQSALDWAAVVHTATPWVEAVRQTPPPFWALERLLNEYPISSAEGLALMRLAEALLRVPDIDTAIALTADQLSHADFDQAGDEVLARLSRTAISLGKRFLPDGEAPGGVFARLSARTVVAAAVRAVQLLGRQFILGQTISEGIDEAAKARRNTKRLRYSYDMLGEGARTDADARRHLASYEQAIEAIAAHASLDVACECNDGISIKLSALFARFDDAQIARVMTELVPRVWSLCEQAARANIGLTIDAEEVDRLELSLDVLEALLERVAAQCPQWRGLGLAVQSYQTRAGALVEHVIALARQYQVRLMCRLVKGAYWDVEIKRAQEMGMSHYPVFTHKHHTDVSYLACARALLDAPDAVYPQFATHNAATIAAIMQMRGDAERAYEFQRLHGMAEGMYREVLKNPAIACRVYAPVGVHKDLLSYLVRRLLENGANTSFVHLLANPAVGLDQLLISPLRLVPESSLPLPLEIFGRARQNSQGLDLAVQTMRDTLLVPYPDVQVPAVPVFDPANVADALAVSAASYASWSQTDVAARAAILRQAADALQAELPRFCGLLVKEAFRAWVDAIAEVREAVDFLRYYANEAERIMQVQIQPGVEDGITLGITGETNELCLVARGPWVCISPWNFPLAIFLGQISAALATGNTVLAKPAELTPGVALEAVKLLHRAGVPEGALQLVHGPGRTVGASLVAAPGVAGVAFTGSIQAAKHIERALAAKDGPIVPLIAETGGVNAMLVDSTALPEQVCDAVVLSAFRSAGQRCSALRLLCVHADVADQVIEMIQGAARELVCGDPADLTTDVGPVIDGNAFEGISRHIARLNVEATPLFVPAVDAHAMTERTANLVPPHVFEVGAIEDVQQEIFGPVLHIVRWRGDPKVVIAQINALGYGLTLGLHTRIDSRAHALARAAHVGNVYVNRNQIGAVVGVQPFGGERLSGTGPKAGGPHYLYRFCAEQVLTINTTAAGGNATLLAGGLV